MRSRCIGIEILIYTTSDVHSAQWDGFRKGESSCVFVVLDIFVFLDHDGAGASPFMGDCAEHTTGPSRLRGDYHIYMYESRRLDGV
jgi:hypothetical protein